MNIPWQELITWIACLTQIVSVVTMVAVRARILGPLCGWVHMVFFVLIAVLGGLAVATFQLGSSSWASCGATLTLVAVGATWEFPAIRTSSSHNEIG